jgi:hypothetical protein
MTNTDYKALKTTKLYDICETAMTEGRYGAALAAADELCQRRDGIETMAPPSVYIAMDAYTAAMLQPLVDRIDLYNSHV